MATNVSRDTGMATNGSSNDFMLNWFNALYGGNFLQMQQSLEKRESLWKHGTKRDTTKTVEREVKRTVKHGTVVVKETSTWEGSSALIEAARFGFVDIVKQWLEIRKVSPISSSETDEKNAGKTGGQNPTPKDVVLEVLLATNGWWKVDAFTIAVVCGSNEVLGLLVDALRERKERPRWIDETKSQLQGSLNPRTVSELPGSADSGNSDRQRAGLREATNEVFAYPKCKECEEKYRIDPYFSSLPIEEYFFHFLCQQPKNNDFRPARLALRKKLESKNCWDFVLKLEDRQGRPPLHAAIWSDTTEAFLDLIQAESDDVTKSRMILAIKTPDGAGRSPIHVAAGLGRSSALKALLEYPEQDVIHAVRESCNQSWTYQEPHFSGGKIPIDINQLSEVLGFGSHHYPYSAVHAALLEGHSECAKLLIETFPDIDWGTYRYSKKKEGKEKVDVIVELDTMQLACLVGADAPVIRLLLDDDGEDGDYLSKQEDPTIAPDLHKHAWHAVHIAAASGKYANLQLLLKDEELVNVEDFQGNSPLHHALRVHEYGFQTHLVDHFKLESVRDEKLSQTAAHKAKELQDMAADAKRRKECIDLLLQRGCDIFAENDFKDVPYPGPLLQHNGKLMSWWSGYQTKALQASANDCVNAANAISVTAALVATTSYVGPLQPPLSYGDHGIHENNVWVIIFMVCDTLSFYLAIAAITISLIPSLPAGWQLLQRKPYTGQDMVTLSVIILYPAIVLLFMAFACSSLSVASANVTSTVAGQLTIATTCVGGLICLLAFILFTIRLLVFILGVHAETNFLSTLDKCTKFSLSLSGTKARLKARLKAKLKSRSE